MGNEAEEPVALVDFEAMQRQLALAGIAPAMQGLVETSNVILVGATNRSADLDAALLDCFARVIAFPLPDQREREAIIRRYARQLGGCGRGGSSPAARHRRRPTWRRT